MSEINKHVYQALDTYCKLTVEPEYAVLLKGSWGCGKSHFVEEFIQKHKDYKFLFVSLYGVASVDAIEDKFFQQLNPILSSKSMILAGKIGKGLLKGTIKLDLDNDGKDDTSANIGIPDIKLADYLTDTKKCILVFDDLERCSMELNQILGYINYFVEKNGYKVIIIADEEKLIEKENADKQPYTSIKEKLIGKTLHLESDVDSVFDLFSKIIITDTDLNKLILENKQLFINIYRQSSYENLRSLRKIFLEFRSLYALLDSKIKNNPELMSHFLQIYAVISMEIYSGSFKVDDLRSIIGFECFLELPDEDVDKAEANLKKVSAKYTVNLRETLIDVSDWQDWFKKGIFDKEKVNSALMKSLYFQNNNSPEWKKLLRLFDLEQSEFDALKVSTWNSFSNDEILEVGAVKQVVSTYLYLAKMKLISKSTSDVLDEAKKIVIEAVRNNKFDIPDSLNPEHDLDSFGGFTFISDGVKEFQEFSTFLNEQVYAYQAQQRENKIPNLLELMSNNVEKFTELMCNQSEERESFAYKPVLDRVPIQQFIEILESLSNVNKNLVNRALHKRYKNQNVSAMKSEFEWIKNVLGKIELKYKNNNSIDGLVMMRFVSGISPYIKSKNNA
ncbi:P-loop NTPase fold protein [Paraglaciecola sp. 2405UD69-4]|uniref:P-loop NTPase fold protein n=1 Tax=Paraglaciecola sp. 2405UD69-4 TaxID=3391836 RepID=UPI0039C94631